MAVGQDILDAVTAESTALASCLTLLQGLVDNGTIPQATVDAIKHTVQSDTDKINAAIAHNTPEAPAA